MSGCTNFTFHELIANCPPAVSITCYMGRVTWVLLHGTCYVGRGSATVTDNQLTSTKRGNYRD